MDHIEDSQDTIRTRTITCQTLFAQCLQLPLDVELDWLEDWQGIFSLWSAGLKAESVGRSSLDYRVRDHAEVRETICGLLDGLSEGLECCISANSTQAESLAADSDQDENQDDMSSVFSDDPDALYLSDFEMNQSPLFGHMFNIKAIIRQLGRVSTAIRQSGTEYRYSKADASLKKEDFKEYEQHLAVVILTGSIKSRAGSINDAIFQPNIFDPDRLTPVQKRLIHANVIRRNRIIYATRSMQEAAKQLQKHDQQPGIVPQALVRNAGTAVVHSSHMAKQKPGPGSSNMRPPLSTTAPSLSRTATDIDSQFDLSKELAKKRTPSVLTKVTKTGDSLDYPNCPKPRSGEGELLQCPYCANLLPVEYLRSHSRWSGHVAQDILPYVCIYENCNAPEKMYLTSSELLQHIHSDHGIIRWVCDHCDSRYTDKSFVFETQESWETHMLQSHFEIALTELPSLERISQRSMPEPISCPLCAYQGDDTRATLEDHIARHLHEFALRCLPWGTSGNDRDSVATRSAGGPLSDSISSSSEESVLVDARFCETENPEDISWRLKNLFCFFESPDCARVLSHRRHILEGDVSEQLSTMTQKYKKLYYAGTMLPSTAEIVSSRLRKILLIMREGLVPSHKQTLIDELEGLEAALSSNSQEPGSPVVKHPSKDETKSNPLIYSAAGDKDTSALEESDLLSRDVLKHRGVDLLHLAAFRGTAIELSQLLRDKHCDPSVPDLFQQTPLHLAVISGSLEAVEILLYHGAEIDYRDKWGCTPLHLAAKAGNYPIAKTLLTHGAEINSVGQDGCQPLRFAAERGHEAIVELLVLLVPDGINTDFRGTYNLWSPLHYAASNGHDDVVNLLLNYHAWINLSSEYTGTALHIAVGFSHKSTVKQLLDKGADPNMSTLDRWTPLHFAAYSNNVDIARLLLEYGADPNIYNSVGWCPLYIAVRNSNTEFASLLLATGAGVHGSGRTTLSPLQFAYSNEDSAMARILLAAGAISPIVPERPASVGLEDDKGSVNIITRRPKFENESSELGPETDSKSMKSEPIKLEPDSTESKPSPEVGSLSLPLDAVMEYPNDEHEFDRMDTQHDVIKLLTDGHLYSAPIAHPTRVLSIGTGSGTWAIELAYQFPDAEIICTDLSSVEPYEAPKNAYFLVDDVTETWPWGPDSFDFIHIGHLISSLPSNHNLLSKSYEHLKPGGYIEFHEFDLKMRCDDGTMPQAVSGASTGYAIQDLMDLLEQSGQKSNPPRQFRVTHLLSQWMREVGFEEVQEQRLQAPVNPWPSDRRLRTVGSWNQANLTKAVARWSYKSLAILGWTKEETDRFLVDVRESIQNRDIHAYMEFYMVTGRKPLTA